MYEIIHSDKEEEKLEEERVTGKNMSKKKSLLKCMTPNNVLKARGEP